MTDATQDAVPRQAGEREDAVVGVVPKSTYRPRTVEACCELFAQLDAQGDAVVVMGSGTERAFGGRPERLDALMRTHELERVVEYAPADQIVTVEAGVTLGGLRRLVAEQKQMFALDPPAADEATIGGLIAANAFGPRRTRYGSIKDLIVGISIVRADGALVRGGGKVVKNVAGFDLPKLMVGSLGTLGMVVRATFRLHPQAETSHSVLVAGCDAQMVFAVHRAMVEERMEPAAVLAVGHHASGTYDVLVTFEGFASGVSAQRDRLLGLAAQHGWVADSPSARDAAQIETLHAAARARTGIAIEVRALPSAFARVHGDVVEPLRGVLEGMQVATYPAVGSTFIAGSKAVGDVVSVLTHARARVEREGGALVVRAAPDAIRDTLDVWGTPPPSIGLMRNVKARFDPQRRLAPGRFVGGI